MRLLNVRLDADDARIAADLRQDGVQLSRIVREALRAAHATVRGPGRRRRRPSAIMADIYAQLPDPPDLAPARYDLRDRRSVRRAITKRIRGRLG